MSEEVLYATVESYFSCKFKLIKHIDGDLEEEFNTDMIYQNVHSSFNKWICVAGQELKHMPEIIKLQTLHESLHKCAADVVKKSNEGKQNVAKQILAKDYSKLSKRITHLLVRLNTALNGFNNRLFV